MSRPGKGTGEGASGGAGSGQLVLVATPIGNLGDVSDRARDALAGADLICCEDTRRTRALLSALGIPGGDRLVSLHGHNEAARLDRVRACVAEGRTVALVSDAGTPAVSDPGALVVAALVADGTPVTTVPGPSAALAALVVSGLPTDRFCVEGFLPRKGGERRRRVAALMEDARTTVLFEAPGRVADTLGDLASLDPNRAVAVARELTKVHEEVWRGTTTEGAALFADAPPRGEVVMVVAGAPAPAPASNEAVRTAVRARLADGAGESAREAADAVAAELGVSRRQAYEAVLRVRGESRGG